MALIFVDHFISNGSYDCYFDTGSNVGVVNYTGPGPQLSFIAIPNAGRGYTEGQFIREFCSDNPDTTKVTCNATATSPFFTFTLEADSASCPAGGGGGGCDIVINSLALTPETAMGANDGSVTINVSSSAGGLTYSIDGSTYQSGNSFTGLIPGNYTAYAKDAADCTTSQPFTINSYFNPVQNFADDLPVVTIAPANISKWNAAFNPIVINFQRKDFSIVSITQQGPTQIAVELNTVLNFAEQQSAINEVVYFKSEDYEYFGKADSYSSYGGHGVLVVTEPYTNDNIYGYLNINNSKHGYLVQVEIKYGIDPVHPKYIYAEYSPGNEGATRADLAAFLQTLINFKDTYNYVDASYSDPNLAASFQVRFREVWTGVTGEWFAAPYPLYVTAAAMQLGQRYGGNMAEYVPFMAVSSPEDKAKWLTGFKQPRYFQGMPFEISFIYSEDLVNQQLVFEFTPDCGGLVDGFLLNADASYLLNADLSRFIISRSAVAGIDVIEALGVNRLLLPDTFDCCATKIDVALYYLDGMGERVDVMQPMTLRTNCVCDEPYVYLKWINQLGAWDYYYFGYNQDLSATISNDVMVKRFVTNWQDDDTIEDIISKSAVDTLVVGADNVTEDDARALQWARKSIKVMMLVNTNPIKWRTVIIKDGGTNIIQSRRAKSSSVVFELLLVSDNIQNQ